MRHLSKKRAASDRAAKPMLAQFAAEFQRCWICGSIWELENHHIASGAGRVDDRRNLMRLSRKCHRQIIHEGEGKWHNFELIACEYALKQLRDPEHYDRVWLNEARFLPYGGCSAEDVRMATALVLEVVKW